jgi:hypothetical protein
MRESVEVLKFEVPCPPFGWLRSLDPGLHEALVSSLLQHFELQHLNTLSKIDFLKNK